MGSALVLLLLLGLSPALSRGQMGSPAPHEDAAGGPGSGAAPGLPVHWDELLGLKELVLRLKTAVVGRRQALRSVESRLRDRELEAGKQRGELEAQVEALRSRMTSSEEEVEELKRRNTALAAELPFLQTRLRWSESTVEQMRKKSAVLAARLCNTESLMEELMKQTSAFLITNTSSVSEASDLEQRLNVRLEDLSTNSQVLLHAGERHLEALQIQTTELETRLDAVEEETNDLWTEHTVLELSMTGLELRLRSAETRLEQQENHSAVQSDQFYSMDSRLTNIHNNISALEVRLRSAETQTEQLEDLTAVQGAVALRLNITEEQLDTLRTQHTDRLTAAQRTTEGLQVRLRAQEAAIAQLKTGRQARLSLLTEVVSRLEATERRGSVLQSGLNRTDALLRTHLEETDVRLTAGEKQLEDLRMEHTVFRFRLNETQKLPNDDSDELKVAFSAGLTDSGSVGPFDEERTLIFSKTIANVGRAYNQTSGVFTAPVRGLYFFSFTVADYLKGYMGVYLYRNNQPIIFNLDLNDHGGYASTSNGVALQLEEGDQIRLSLPASYRLYDDSRNFSVFSGFLLFAL
ncbi:myosin-2 heavy chain, non muscle-like [Antennarius striatus]|uniref:myosin-2 heavy chain, non muscle-like n=1 Tax=Antennarius striatus TaxID=241820 RepID=UPI0035B2D32F